MATVAEQAIREISKALKELDKISSSRVTRDGDHFSFALPERQPIGEQPSRDNDRKPSRS